MRSLLKKYFFLSLCLCVSVVINLSCGSKPVDPRAVIPADSLVYLETSDLGKVMDAITSNPSFQQLAKTKPDTSALNGIRLSVAVTGFQTSEEAVNNENSVLNFKPHFVAVAETNAWNYQALSFAENKLGEFINHIYGGEIELVTSDKHGGSYFTWTAQDGRKAYALVRGSLIFFGNDESAIDRCINVLNGEAESIAKNQKVTALPPESLAAGYVSADGVAQIANIAGISLAMGASEEGEVKSFIARVLPEIARNSVTEVTWTSTRSDSGRIEDNYLLSLKPDAAKVLSETIVPANAAENDLSRFVPKDFLSTTRYNLRDAQIAWRSVVLTAQSKTDQLSGNLIGAFSSSVFEPFAIEDPEMFFSAAGNVLQTVRFDTDDEAVVITQIKDLDRLKKSIAKEINFAKPPEKQENADIWRSQDEELSAAIVENLIILGDAKSVEKCLTARNNSQSVENKADKGVSGSNAAIATVGTDSDPEAKLIEVLTERKDDKTQLTQTYLTETRFNQNGIERRTTSDFGLIGAIIGQFDLDN